MLGYRLVGALRILPAAPKTGLTAGNAKAVKGTAVVAGQEHRQHARPGQRHGRASRAPAGPSNIALAAIKILPGKSINVPLGSKLAKGSYTATLSLKQRGKTVADGDEEVHGQMRNLDSRPIRRSGGYARRGSVGALTTVWVGRSDSGRRVLGSSVVTMRILEGKQ